MTRIQMSQWIVDREARRDADGHIILYNLPANDGGGTHEYAGINSRYHPKVLARLVSLVRLGKNEQAEHEAVEYLANYTEGAASWSLLESVDLFMRDTAFNRGPGGAAKILQRALRVKDDGDVGKITLAALREWEKRPLTLLARLRSARERYELDVPGYRANLWEGLENRWDAVFEKSSDIELKRSA